MALPKFLKKAFGSEEKPTILPPPKPEEHRKQVNKNLSPSGLEQSTADEFEAPLREPLSDVIGKPLPHQKTSTIQPPELKKPKSNEITSPQPVPPPRPDPEETKEEDKKAADAIQKEIDAKRKAEKKAAEKEATKRLIRDLLAAEKSAESVEDVASHTPPKQHYQKNNPFYLESGTIIHSVHDLRMAAKSMSNEVFSHHVTAERNDFAHWLKSSVQHDDLAKKVQNVKNATDLYHALDPNIPKKPIKKEESPSELPEIEVEDNGNELQGIHSQFVSLKSELNNDLDESISLLKDQGEKISQLRDEVQETTEQLREEEKDLRRELSDLHEKRSNLQNEIERLKKENAKLLAEKRDAELVQEEINEMRTNLSGKQKELAEARQRFASHMKPAKESTEDVSVDIIIESIKENIASGKVHAARAEYSEARDLYYNSDDLSDAQRKKLHQELIDLYTKINLAS